MTQILGGPAKTKTKLEEKGVEEEVNLEPEEDSDYEIYFDKFTLLEHLTHLEEDNLFNIQLIQEDEEALDNFKKESQSKIYMKETELKDIEHNIGILVSSKEQLL